MKAKILCFAGSLRQDSVNKKLARLAGRMAEAAGAEVTFVDLKEYPLPIYDGDIEASEGLPENAKKFKSLMKSHQGFFIASPEYNSTFSAALKNVIDWASRPEPGEEPLACFSGKVVALAAASPGALGGLRGLAGLRSMLSTIKVVVIPEQYALSQAHEAFSSEGTLKDPKQEKALQAVAQRLVELTTLIHVGQPARV